MKNVWKLILASFAFAATLQSPMARAQDRRVCSDKLSDGTCVNLLLSERKLCSEGFAGLGEEACLREFVKRPSSRIATSMCSKFSSADTQLECLDLYTRVFPNFVGAYCTFSVDENESEGQRLACLRGVADRSYTDQEISSCMPALRRANSSEDFLVCMQSRGSVTPAHKISAEVYSTQSSVPGKATLGHVSSMESSLPTTGARIQIKSNSPCEYRLVERVAELSSISYVTAEGPSGALCSGKISFALGNYRFSQNFSNRLP